MSDTVVRLGRWTFRRMGCAHCGEGIKGVEIIGPQDTDSPQKITGGAAVALWRAMSRIAEHDEARL